MIKKVSARQAARNQVYKVVIEAWKKDPKNKRCRYPGCSVREVQPHHVRGRLKNLLWDVRYIIPLCFVHHTFVHNNPEKSRALGLLCQKGDWNKQP